MLLADDATLCRYLRARKHDIPRAKAMVLETIKWRAEVGADGILDGFDFPEREVFHQHYPEGFYCTDRSGRPVYVQRPGSIDCDELWKFTTLDRSITYHIKQQEKYVRRVAPAASVAAGQPMQQSVVLIDMQGASVLMSLWFGKSAWGEGTGLRGLPLLWKAPSCLPPAIRQAYTRAGVFAQALG